MNPATDRRYFKLPAGYLHVDDSGLALTRSGNWAEAAKAPERTRRVGIARTMRIILGIGLILVGMAFYTAKGLRTGGSMAFVFAAVGAALGVYKLIDKFQNDLGHTFRIPFAKVRSMHWAEGRLEVAFVNGHWKEDRTRIDLMEPDAAWVKDAWRQSRD